MRENFRRPKDRCVLNIICLPLRWRTFFYLIHNDVWHYSNCLLIFIDSLLEWNFTEYFDFLIEFDRIHWEWKLRVNKGEINPLCSKTVEVAAFDIHNGKLQMNDERLPFSIRNFYFLTYLTLRTFLTFPWIIICFKENVIRSLKNSQWQRVTFCLKIIGSKWAQPMYQRLTSIRIIWTSWRRIEGIQKAAAP